MKKLMTIALLLVLLMFLMMLVVRQALPVTHVGIEDNQPIVSATAIPSPLPPSGATLRETINPGENLCPQISSAFVSEVTGIAIKRVTALHGPAINACDYYLAEDKNAPYIAIIVNKNLNFDTHKHIALKNGLVVKTDPRISGNHYIAWADKETRISYIDIYINETSFLRIDKNVERAIDNQNMIKLASAVSTR